MSRVRSAETGPEIALRRAVFGMGGRYRLRPQVVGTPDLAFLKARVAVFVDGCFWHGCPVHYRAPVQNAEFWREKLRRNVERDRRVDAVLTVSGWRVVRIWEHDVRQDVGSVANRLLSLVAERIDARVSDARPSG